MGPAGAENERLVGVLYFDDTRFEVHLDDACWRQETVSVLRPFFRVSESRRKGAPKFDDWAVLKDPDKGEEWRVYETKHSEPHPEQVRLSKAFLSYLKESAAFNEAWEAANAAKLRILRIKEVRNHRFTKEELVKLLEAFTTRARPRHGERVSPKILWEMECDSLEDAVGSHRRWTFVSAYR